MMDLTSSSRRRLPSSLTARFENKSEPKATPRIGGNIEQKRTLDGNPVVGGSNAGNFEIQTKQEKPEVSFSNRTENGSSALKVCEQLKEIKGNGDYTMLKEDATFLEAKTANDTIQPGEAVTEHDFYSASWSETDYLAPNTELVDETEAEFEAKRCSEIWIDSGSKDFSSTWTDVEPFVTPENDAPFSSEDLPGHILNLSENVESSPTSSVVRNDSISSDTKSMHGNLHCNLASNENAPSVLEPWTCLDAKIDTSFDLEPQSGSLAALEVEGSPECLDPGPDEEVHRCYDDIAEFDVDALNYEGVSDNELPSLQDVYQRCQTIRNQRFYGDLYSAWRQKTQEEAKEDALKILKSCGFCPADPDEIGEDLDAGLSLVPDRFWQQESKANEIFVEDMKAILEEKKDAESRKQFQKYCASVERDSHRPKRRSAIVLGDGGGTSSLLFDCLKMNLLINCVPLYYFPSYLNRYLATMEQEHVEGMD